MNQTQNDPVAPTPPHEAETTSNRPAKGASEMRIAANIALELHNLDIAQALAKSAMDGHIQSARFLYLLAEGQQKLEAEQVVQQLESLAIELAQQPEWPEPLDEETAETALGSREPEG